MVQARSPAPAAVCRQGVQGMRRFCFSLVFGLTLVLPMGAGVAHACVAQSASAGPAGGSPGDPVHPGDPMSWSITRLEPGATYTVSLGGQTIASGVADASGTVTRPFTMPDFGPQPRDLIFSAIARHEDIEGGETPPLTSHVRYEP